MLDRDIARVCHEANRALQHLHGDPDPSPPWDDAPEWQKTSALNGVVAAQSGATPEELHDNWCQDKTNDGWRWGPVKDPVAKTHPCLVGYPSLPEDRVFAAIVHALS